ncbi:MAG: hypothetical protein EBU01_16025, partial [Crocinitomicaceae bacterium]|nr:hypothetical protein [Crocinitomicaceae bacterium]
TSQGVILSIVNIDKEIGSSNKNLDLALILNQTIFYGNQKIEFENLIIPHPKYTERDFVLLPISELINYQDPITFLLTKQLSE